MKWGTFISCVQTRFKGHSVESFESIPMFMLVSFKFKDEFGFTLTVFFIYICFTWMHSRMIILDTVFMPKVTYNFNQKALWNSFYVFIFIFLAFLNCSLLASFLSNFLLLFISSIFIFFSLTNIFKILLFTGLFVICMMKMFNSL